MRNITWAAVAAAVLAGGGTAAADNTTQFKPVDTDKLVRRPSRAVADIGAQTVKLLGDATAKQVEGDGWIKTINNLFTFRRTTRTPTQPGMSRLPLPSAYPSTGYKSYNTPAMPTSQPTRR